LVHIKHTVTKPKVCIAKRYTSVSVPNKKKTVFTKKEKKLNCAYTNNLFVIRLVAHSDNNNSFIKSHVIL